MGWEGKGGLEGGMDRKEKREGRQGMEIETYGSVSTLEHAQLLLGGSILIRRHDGLQNLLGDIPKLGVLILQQQHDAGGLGVE